MAGAGFAGLAAQPNTSLAILGSNTNPDGTTFSLNVNLTSGSGGTTPPIPITPTDGSKATYSVAFNLNAPSGLCVVMAGSATKLIRVTDIGISSNATAATPDFTINKYSTAASGGTGSPVTAAPHDSTNPAVTAVVTAYTAAATAGSLVAAVRKFYYATPGTAPATGAPLVQELSFGSRPAQALVLRGVAQQIGIVTSGAIANIEVHIEWTEE